MDYQPDNCYWFVAGDTTQVFASDRMTYVTAADSAYQSWLDMGNTTSRNPSAVDLSDVLIDYALPLVLAKGVQFTSKRVPVLNAVYSLDNTSLNAVGNVARDVVAGFGFPLGNSTFSCKDHDGNVHDFDEQAIQNFYKSARNYIASLTVAIRARASHATDALPNTPVVID